MLNSVTPAQASALLREGALLVDVREPGEHVRARIPGAINLPLSRLRQAELALHHGQPVLFHCRSGARTRFNAAPLAAKAKPCDAYVVAGGLDAWRWAGLPVVEEAPASGAWMAKAQRIAGVLFLLVLAIGIAISL